METMMDDREKWVSRDGRFIRLSLARRVYLAIRRALLRAWYAPSEWRRNRAAIREWRRGRAAIREFMEWLRDRSL